MMPRQRDVSLVGASATRQQWSQGRIGLGILTARRIAYSTYPCAYKDTSATTSDYLLSWSQFANAPVIFGYRANNH
jgi:hypothetical protein